jgi:hypothetical protein
MPRSGLGFVMIASTAEQTLFHFSCKEGYPRPRWPRFAPCSPATSEPATLTPCELPGE